MGLVITDKSIDDSYSGEVIRKAMTLSPEIDEYVTTQQYLRETPEENLTPAWLRNKVLTIVLAQLEDRGIKFNIAESVALDDPLAVQALLFLRSKFDRDSLYDLFRSHQDVVDYVREITDDVDCIGDIIGYCYRLFYIDDGWKALGEFVDMKPGVIESTAAFTDELDEVMTRLDSLGATSVMTDYNGAVIGSYLNYLGKRKSSIEKLAKTIYSTSISVESNTITTGSSKCIAVEAFMSGFERELARPNVVENLDPDDHNIDVNKIRAKFKSRWQHTLDYWVTPEHANQYPTELAFAVMIATMYHDLGAKPAARAQIVGIFEEMGDMLGDRYEKFRAMLDNALGNLVIVSESEVK